MARLARIRLSDKQIAELSWGWLTLESSLLDTIPRGRRLMANLDKAHAALLAESKRPQERAPAAAIALEEEQRRLLVRQNALLRGAYGLLTAQAELGFDKSDLRRIWRKPRCLDLDIRNHVGIDQLERILIVRIVDPKRPVSNERGAVRGRP